MKLTLVHLQVEFSKVEYNFNQIKLSYIKAANNGSELVIFPEFSLTGYCVLSKDITIDVIGCNTSRLEEYHYMIYELVKEYKVPMTIGSFAYNDKTDSGTVAAYYLITVDGITLVKEKQQHSKLSHPYSIDYRYGGALSKQISINNLTMNTLICSETMDESLVDSMLECDILLNPSAFGELPPYIDYPIICSKQSKLDKLLILTPNQTINTDTYNLGRTIIRRGNTVVFQHSSLHTTLIHLESDTDEIKTSIL